MKKKVLTLLYLFPLLLTVTNGAMLRTELIEKADNFSSPRKVVDLGTFLEDTSKTKTTADGWPFLPFFIEYLIPFGPPDWHLPEKSQNLCMRYKSKHGETVEYRALKIQHNLMTAYRALRLGKAGLESIENLQEYAAPFLDEAADLLEATPLEYRGSHWYVSKLRQLSLAESELTELIKLIREECPLDPAILETWIHMTRASLNDIEDELNLRNISEEDRAMLYARAASTLVLAGEGKLSGLIHSVSWEMLLYGCRLLAEVYPSDHNLDIYRFFLCHAEEQERAKKLFEDGPEQPVTFLWTTSEFPFEDWKQWATGKFTFPKVQNSKEMLGVWKITSSFQIYPRVSDSYYERVPNYYIYHPDNTLQIIWLKKRGINYRTRHWNIESSGHLKITKTKYEPVGQTWSQTVFSDGFNMIRQHLSAPFGTTYLTYIGEIEDELPAIEELYSELNPVATLE